MRRRISILASAIVLVFAWSAMGLAVDWDDIEPLATATGQNAVSLKVFDDETHLYILVEGNNLNTTSQVFINNDGNSATGFAYWQWGSAGFEFLLENDGLFRYAGGNSADWSWEEIEDPGVSMVKTDTAIEIKIPKSVLEIESDTITLGYVQLNENWQTIGALPRLLPARYNLAN